MPRSSRTDADNHGEQAKDAKVAKAGKEVKAYKEDLAKSQGLESSAQLDHTVLAQAADVDAQFEETGQYGDSGLAGDSLASASPSTTPDFVDVEEFKAATSIPVGRLHVTTGCFNKTVSRRKGGATYSRLDAPPAANLQNNKAFVHVTADANGGPQSSTDPALRGSWWLLMPSEGGCKFFQLGGQTGNYAQFNTPQAAINTQAFNDFKQLLVLDWYNDFNKLIFEPGWLPFSKTLVLDERAAYLYGNRASYDWAHGPVLGFPKGQDGLIIHYDNTRGDKTTNQVFVQPQDRTGGFASGTIVEKLAFFSEANVLRDYRDIADGILARGKAFFRDVAILGFPRHGFHIATSCDAQNDNWGAIGNGYPAGNANNCEVSNCIGLWNGGAGIKLQGPDSNACKILGNDFSFSGWWGWENIPFLGPTTIIGNHTTDTALGQGSTMCHGYLHTDATGGIKKPGALVTFDHGSAGGGIKTYVAVAPTNFGSHSQRWRDYVATQPGTNEGIWQWYHDGANQFAKAWLPNQPVGTYTHGGSSYTAGVNLWTSDRESYHEGAEPPVQFYCRRGILEGGANGGFILKGSFGRIWDDGFWRSELLQQRDILSIDGKKWFSLEHSTLGYEENRPFVRKWSDSRFVRPIYEQYEGGHIATRYQWPGSPSDSAFKYLTGQNKADPDKTDAPPIVGGSGREVPSFTELHRSTALATQFYPWAVTVYRTHIAHHDAELLDMDLQRGDLVLHSANEDPNNPIQPVAARPGAGGWLGRYILKDSPKGSQAQFVRFGKLDTEVVTVGTAPPPPPPPASIFSRVDASITVDGSKVTKTSGDGTRAKAIVSTKAGTGLRAFDVTVGAVTDIGIGLATANEPLDGTLLGANSANSAVVWNNGWTQDNAGNWAQVAGFAQGQTVRVTYDSGTKEAKWFVNGTVALTRTLALTGDVFPAVSLRYLNDSVTFNLSPASLPSGTSKWV